jgi:murein DD-endopeptidase MepM/ murein hydrolase activator NlpD
LKQNSICDYVRLNEYLEDYYNKLIEQNKPLTFSVLPVASKNLEWIQWFGGTSYAYQSGEEWNYDGYCQGFHCGIDFGASWGTPIRAGSYGVVENVWVEGGKDPGTFGRYRIDIRYGDYRIIYGHTDGRAFVKPGDYVMPGTIIAGVGNPKGEGDNNTHIHLEIRGSSSGNSEYKDLIYNPLIYMGEDDYSNLVSLAVDQDD